MDPLRYGMEITPLTDSRCGATNSAKREERGANNWRALWFQALSAYLIKPKFKALGV
jgi:hypothetical protein